MKAELTDGVGVSCWPSAKAPGPQCPSPSLPRSLWATRAKELTASDLGASEAPREKDVRAGQPSLGEPRGEQPPRRTAGVLNTPLPARIIVISSLRLLSRPRHQLHTPELGVCQSGFPHIARVVLSVCLHTEQSCINGAGDMNGEEGWYTDPGNADIPTGSPHGGHCASDSVTATMCHSRKQKGLMTLNCSGAV
ncbi:hypothetical protein EYF80_002269 [Liparis tanakae]|uniref:Uncharacterized protein n=1 Tax=Liparis tanakae TaxID=230148 RepID=A0A4Z2JE84_9TELE|nr:hypothetical protein EYF80_002269 [Liparis tanakae]